VQQEVPGNLSLKLKFWPFGTLHSISCLLGLPHISSHITNDPQILLASGLHGYTVTLKI